MYHLLAEAEEAGDLVAWAGSVEATLTLSVAAGDWVAWTEPCSAILAPELEPKGGALGHLAKRVWVCV